MLCWCIHFVCVGVFIHARISLNIYIYFTFISVWFSSRGSRSRFFRKLLDKRMLHTSVFVEAEKQCDNNRSEEKLNIMMDTKWEKVSIRIQVNASSRAELNRNELS